MSEKIAPPQRIKTNKYGKVTTIIAERVSCSLCHAMFWRWPGQKMTRCAPCLFKTQPRKGGNDG